MKPNIILLGGVPGTGKTTLAYQLALSLHVDKVISLDILKEAAKTYISFNDCPYLYSTTHESYQIESLDPISGFQKHCQIIQNLLLTLLEKLTDEHIVIVEGAQLTPDFLSYAEGLFRPIYFNLYSDSVATLLSRYEMKSRMRSYHWTENINIILQIQRYLLSFPNVNHISIKKEFPFEKVSEMINLFMEEN